MYWLENKEINSIVSNFLPSLKKRGRGRFSEQNQFMAMLFPDGLNQ
jgi:hypothetical protein